MRWRRGLPALIPAAIAVGASTLLSLPPPEPRGWLLWALFDAPSELLRGHRLPAMEHSRSFILHIGEAGRSLPSAFPAALVVGITGLSWSARRLTPAPAVSRRVWFLALVSCTALALSAAADMVISLPSGWDMARYYIILLAGGSIPVLFAGAGPSGIAAVQAGPVPAAAGNREGDGR